jgi:hypothetical protein
MRIQISEWDTNHFGFKIAKLLYTKAPSHIQKAIQESKRIGSKLLISRCPTDDFGWIHELERRGFQFMDTIIYYSIDLTDYQMPEPKYQAREATDNDIPAVRWIARESFKGYISHFHADPELDKKKCDENLSNHIIVIEIERMLAAFLTIKVKDHGKIGETVLSAVDPLVRGKAVYTDIIIHGLKWISSQGCTKFETSTQIINTSVQKAWARLGSSIDRSYYTFHLWL